MYKIQKNVIIFPQLIKHFLIILKIIQYALFMKLTAITDNEIFHVKGKEFLSIINIYRRRELVEFLSREEKRVTQNFIGIPITH